MKFPRSPCNVPLGRQKLRLYIPKLQRAERAQRRQVGEAASVWARGKNPPCFGQNKSQAHVTEELSNAICGHFVFMGTAMI